MAQACCACPRGTSTETRRPNRPRNARCARRLVCRLSWCQSWGRCATGIAATGARCPSRCGSSSSATSQAIRRTTTTRCRRLAGWTSARLRRRSATKASARWWRWRGQRLQRTDSLLNVQVLNFYSTIFADELKRGRKTATIRLGDKSAKYRKNQLVLITIGYQHSPRERIFEAVIDQVEVMKLADLSPRDIKHDNPEFRRHEELISFLEQIYGREVSVEDVVTVVRFSQILDTPSGMTQAMKGFGGAQN